MLALLHQLLPLFLVASQFPLMVLIAIRLLHPHQPSTLGYQWHQRYLHQLCRTPTTPDFQAAGQYRTRVKWCRPARPLCSTFQSASSTSSPAVLPEASSSPASYKIPPTTITSILQPTPRTVSVQQEQADVSQSMHAAPAARTLLSAAASFRCSRHQAWVTLGFSFFLYYLA